MAALRKFLHLEAYLHPVHFENLGKLLLMMSLLWAYFVFAERLTTWFGNDTADSLVFSLQSGEFMRPTFDCLALSCGRYRPPAGTPC